MFQYFPLVRIIDTNIVISFITMFILTNITVSISSSLISYAFIGEFIHTLLIRTRISAPSSLGRPIQYVSTLTVVICHHSSTTGTDIITSSTISLSAVHPNYHPYLIIIHPLLFTQSSLKRPPLPSPPSSYRFPSR